MDAAEWSAGCCPMALCQEFTKAMARDAEIIEALPGSAVDECGTIAASQAL